MNERENISRICNCIKALAKNHVLLYDTSIYYAYEISQQYQVNMKMTRVRYIILNILLLIFKIKEILEPKIAKEIADKTEEKLASDNQ